jgi:hypothetical protein
MYHISMPKLIVAIIKERTMDWRALAVVSSYVTGVEVRLAKDRRYS